MFFDEVNISLLYFIQLMFILKPHLIIDSLLKADLFKSDWTLDCPSSKGNHAPTQKFERPNGTNTKSKIFSKSV